MDKTKETTTSKNKELKNINPPTENKQESDGNKLIEHLNDQDLLEQVEDLDQEPSNMRNSRKLIRNIIIAIIIGLSTTSVIIIFSSDKNFFVKLLSMPPQILIAGACAFFLTFVIDSFRVRSGIRTFNKKVKFIYLLRGTILGVFFNHITPTSSSGQPFRIYDLKKQGINVIDSSSIMITRYLVQTFIATIMSLIAYSLYRTTFIRLGITGNIILIAFFISILTTVLISIFAVSNRVKRFFFKVLHLKFIKKLMGMTNHTPDEIEQTIDEKVKELREGMHNLWVRNKLYLVIDASLTILCRIIEALILYLFFKYFIASTGKHPKFIDIFFIGYILNLVIFFIPTPGASGAFEAAYFQVFNMPDFSSSSTEILAGITSYRIVSYYIPILLGLIVMFFYIKKDRKEEVNK